MRKVSKYGVFSGPFFPLFLLNTEIYGESLRIQSEYGKYGPEKTPYLDTFHAVFVFLFALHISEAHPEIS